MNEQAAPVHTDYPIVSQLITGYDRPGSVVWTYREYGTTDWLLIYTLSGQGRFGFEGGQVIAQAGEMVLLRPRTRHDYGAESTPGQWERLWTHFHPLPHWRELLDWPEEAPGLMRLKLGDSDSRKKIVNRFFDAHRLANGALRRREQFAMNALEEVLLWCDAQNPQSGHAGLDVRVQQAMDYMCHNLREDISLALLAQVSGLSVSRLSHLFRQQFGTSPQGFLEQQRIRRAKQLLELTPRTIQDVAVEVGYNSPFYFSQRFKRHTGLSP